MDNSIEKISELIGKVALTKSREIADLLPKIDLPKYEIPKFEFDLPAFDTQNFEMPMLEPINPEETIIGDIKHKIEEQNKLVSQQMGILIEQNKLLADNYSKLKDMYDAQTASYQSTQEDLKRSRRYNVIMMIVAIVAMLAAIAGPVVTILVSG